MNDIEKINQAIEEIEISTLSNDTKTTVLKVLREQLRLEQIRQQKIQQDIDYVTGSKTNR